MLINQTFKINNNGRDFFVGDLHGGYTSLMRILRRLRFSPDLDRVFCVGDLIDRGNDSVKCLNLLSENWFFSILGNHEEFMLGVESLNSYKAGTWFNNGGVWWKELSVTERETYKIIVSKLPITISVDTVCGSIGLVHADYPFNTWPPENEVFIPLKKMLWGRDDVASDNSSVINSIRYIISGHTPVKDAFVKGNRIFLDTGEGYSPSELIPNPRLTICEFSGDSISFYCYQREALVQRKVYL